jgi:hypothetical protein
MAAFEYHDGASELYQAGIQAESIGHFRSAVDYFKEAQGALKIQSIIADSLRDYPAIETVPLQSAIVEREKGLTLVQSAIVTGESFFLTEAVRDIGHSILVIDMMIQKGEYQVKPGAEPKRRALLAEKGWSVSMLGLTTTVASYLFDKPTPEGTNSFDEAKKLLEAGDNCDYCSWNINLSNKSKLLAQKPKIERLPEDLMPTFQLIGRATSSAAWTIE